MIQRGVSCTPFCLRNVMEMFEDLPGTQMTLVLILNDLVIFMVQPRKKGHIGPCMAF